MKPKILEVSKGEVTREPNPAKQVKFTCPVCGVTKWVCRTPSIRKACSYQCSAISRRILPDRECPICQKMFRPRNHKSIVCSLECSFKYKSLDSKAKGITPQMFLDRRKWLASLRKPETGAKKRKAHLGRIHVKPKTARNSAQHGRAAVFFVRSPQNVIYLVMNITKFVDENASLFPQDAVNWKWRGKSRQCRATIGLHSIHRGHRGVWRGWMLISDREGTENLSLLPRTVIKNPPD